MKFKSWWVEAAWTLFGIAVALCILGAILFAWYSWDVAVYGDWRCMFAQCRIEK